MLLNFKFSELLIDCQDLLKGTRLSPSARLLRYAVRAVCLQLNSLPCTSFPDKLNHENITEDVDAAARM